MTRASMDRRHQHEPLFDVDAVTGASIEVFYADTRLATFGSGGTGYFWQVRQRGFAPEGKATGPFPTSYSAYRAAVGGIAHFLTRGCNPVATTIEQEIT